jgi:UDP-glucuronate 4-epimerase
MTVLVTGAAGFIGYHVSAALLARGERVLGIDHLGDYYDPKLKQARLDRLGASADFRFRRIDISNPDDVMALAGESPAIDRIVHLAAQAGVRHSFARPFDYISANVTGHLAILELARQMSAARPGAIRHLVYASSSSVYGGNETQPFSVEDRTDRPLSLYGATKKADELMAESYAHLFRVPTTGLRYFTVYGPWGRPDMSAWIFARAILEGRPITLFNHGRMKRDFTFVDDIVAGTLAALDRPPADDGRAVPHRIYNLGNHRSEELRRFVGVIEAALGRSAVIEFKPMQPGDVPETCADITSAARDLGFQPKTTIDEGLPRFAAWFRDYHRI